METEPHPLSTRDDIKRVRDNLAEAVRFWQSQPAYTVNHFRAAVVDLEGILRRLPPEAAKTSEEPSEGVRTAWGAFPVGATTSLHHGLLLTIPEVYQARINATTDMDDDGNRIWYATITVYQSEKLGEPLPSVMVSGKPLSPEKAAALWEAMG